MRCTANIPCDAKVRKLDAQHRHVRRGRPGRRHRLSLGTCLRVGAAGPHDLVVGRHKVRAEDEQVLGLDVAVHDAARVQVRKRAERLEDDVARLRLREVARRYDGLEELTARGHLRHNHDAIAQQLRELAAGAGTSAGGAGTGAGGAGNSVRTRVLAVKNLVHSNDVRVAFERAQDAHLVEQRARALGAAAAAGATAGAGASAGAGGGAVTWREAEAAAVDHLGRAPLAARAMSAGHDEAE